MKWECIKFKELYEEESRNGLTKPSNVRGQGFKMINMGELFANERIFDIPMELVPLTEKEKENARVRENDLLFARQSLVLEGAGKCSIVLETSPLTVFESHLIRVRLNNNNAVPMFYYYYFKSPLSPIKTIVSQCAQAGIRGSDLAEIIVTYPPIETQHRIADILSAYDDLIENNRKQIKLLEEAAQRLYKEWFVDLRFPGFENVPVVDGVPEGWSRGALKELIAVNYGKDHKKVPDDGEIPVYGSGGLMRKCNRSLFSGEAVLIPRKGSLNNIMYVNEAFWTVDTMFYATMKKPNTALYVYFFIKSNDMYSMNIGAAVPSMTVQILDAMDVLIPANDVLISYDTAARKLFSKISVLNKQIEALQQARDRLLPKLMSGEVEV